MSFMRSYIIFFSFIFFFIPANTYAYLDPGTGSFIIQIIIAFALGAVIFIKIYFNKIKDFFSKIFSKKKSKDEKPDDLS